MLSVANFISYNEIDVSRSSLETICDTHGDSAAVLNEVVICIYNYSALSIYLYIS